MTITKAIIPAAGWGTRFLPATKAVPKEMVPIAGKPVIQYVVEEAAAAGITDLCIVISAGKEAIQRHFARDPELERFLADKGKAAELAAVQALHQLADIHYVYQHEMLGLGHAVYQGRTFAGDAPFAVLLGDTIVRSTSDRSIAGQLCDVFADYGDPVVACERVPMDRVSRYGVLDADPIAGPIYHAKSLVEKPSPEDAPSDLAIASRYVFTADIFAELERTRRGTGGEIQLTDAMCSLAARRRFLGRVIDGERFDVGNPSGALEAAQKLIQGARPTRPARQS